MVETGKLETVEPLSPREQEVLDLLRRGLTNSQIADHLRISRDGAKYHVSTVIGKLGVRNRYEAGFWPEPAPWWARGAIIAPAGFLWRRLWEGASAKLALAAGALSVGALSTLLAFLSFLIFFSVRNGGDQFAESSARSGGDAEIHVPASPAASAQGSEPIGPPAPTAGPPARVLTLTPRNATNPMGTDHTVTATVTRDGVPLEGEYVVIAVLDGPNSVFNGNARGTVQGPTDANGQLSLTYTGDGGAGTDIITACLVEILDACNSDADEADQVTNTWAIGGLSLVDCWLEFDRGLWQRQGSMGDYCRDAGGGDRGISAPGGFPWPGAY